MVLGNAWLNSFAVGNPSITAQTIPNDGGYELDLTVIAGSIPDGDYFVHLGPEEGSTDPTCYSGVIGRGQQVRITGNQLYCISPILPVGGPYRFFLRLVSNPATTILTEPAITVIPHAFSSRTLTLRKLLPRNWRTGYRDQEGEEFPQS